MRALPVSVSDFFQVDYLYLMNEPFCWTSTHIGLVGSIKYGVSTITSLFLLLPLQRVLSAPCLALLGAISFLACDVLTGLAHSALLIYLGNAQPLDWTDRGAND